jgi:hypothetical protein
MLCRKLDVYDERKPQLLGQVTFTGWVLHVQLQVVKPVLLWFERLKLTEVKRISRAQPFGSPALSAICRISA